MILGTILVVFRVDFVSLDVFPPSTSLTKKIHGEHKKTYLHEDMFLKNKLL